MSLKSNPEKQDHTFDTRGLVIPYRQLSFVCAGFLLLSFALFMAGYFLGKKQAIDQLIDTVESESFSDQIYTSLCTINHKESPDEEEEEEKGESEKEQEASSLVPEIGMEDEEELVSAPDMNSSLVSPAAQTRYQALLIGFSTEKAAHNCVRRLQKKGFPVHSAQRMSKTSRGKLVAWYQVVSDEYPHRAEVEELVDRISKEERIKDARIIVIT